MSATVVAPVLQTPSQAPDADQTILKSSRPHRLQIICFTVVALLASVTLLLGTVQKWLWMRQLGYSGVFCTLFSVKWVIFLVAFGIAGLLLWSNLRATARTVHGIGEDPATGDLDWVVFYQKRAFTRSQFRDFWFEQMQPYPKMIELIRRLKLKHGLKVVVVSIDSRAVNAYRVRKLKLYRLVDTFISSCFVGMRKPDADIFRFALDFAQAKRSQVIFIDNTAMFVQVAEALGIRGVLHTDYTSTCAKLTSFGLSPGQEVTP